MRGLVDLDEYGNDKIISLGFWRIAAFELQKSYSTSVWMIQLSDHITKDFWLSLRTVFKLLVFFINPNSYSEKIIKRMQ